MLPARAASEGVWEVFGRIREFWHTVEETCKEV